MGRITGSVQTGQLQLFFHHFLHTADTDPALIPAYEQGVFILGNDFFRITHSKIVVDGFPTALSKIDHPLFIAFAGNAQMILVDIRKVQRDKLRNAHTAGHEQHQDAIIAQSEATVTGGQQTLTFCFFQIPGQRGRAFGHVKFLTNVEIQEMAFCSQVVVKGLDRGGAAAAAGSGEGLVGAAHFRRKRLITVQLLNSDGLDKVQVNIADVDLIEGSIGWDKAAPALDIAKKNFQIQIISGDGLVRMASHRGMILQKLHKEIWRVVDLIQVHYVNLS